MGIREREPDTYLFMYVSTAAITGIFLLLMLFSRPAHILLAQILVVGVAAVTFIVTIPLRKSLAIALDYLF